MMDAKQAAALWPDDPEAVLEFCTEGTMIDAGGQEWRTGISSRESIRRVAKVALIISVLDRYAFLRFVAGEGER